MSRWPASWPAGGPRIAGHERHCQRSGRVVRASADCPAASTSIQAVAWLSGGTTCRRSAISPPIPLRPRVRLACQCPVVAYPNHRLEIQFIRPVAHVAHRPAGVHVQYGVAEAGVQAEDPSMIPSVRETRRPRRRSRRAPVPPWCSCGGSASACSATVRAVAGERDGDAVDADADPPGGQPLEGASIQRCDMYARQDRPAHFAYYSLQARMV